MRTRSSSNLIVESSTIPKRRNRRRSKQIVELELRTIVETSVATMADTRNMSKLLQAPTEGNGDAIVIPAILAENFELKVSTTTSSPSPSPDVIALTEIVKELVLMNKATQQATMKAIEETCVTYGRPHPYYECLATDGNTFDACAARQSPSGLGSLLSDTVANPRGELKAITTRSGVSYDGPMIPPTSSPLPKEAGCELKATKDKVQTINLGSTAHVQPSVIQVPILEPDVASKPNPKPSIPYPSRLNDQKLHEKSNNQMHTSRYSYIYDDESVNRIDVIDVTCEEYAQEGGAFVLEEIEACLTSDSIPPGIDDADFDLEGDIILLEMLLNDDPSSPLPSKELNFEELKIIKSSIDDPPELELKDLPSHLEYAFLEETNKLPVIISKDLKDDEKARLLKVLKSHKRVIAWKIFDIKGTGP
ncbi:hypothetical protein Tco_0703862 [Tanacetum coccineum]|uniref:Reverse transcriptase domain-containing protein n=1 Tax=Tanacetum coccineum TaxID=301880 RepID=A0ABQ4Y0H5_9ASTR